MTSLLYPDQFDWSNGPFLSSVSSVTITSIAYVLIVVLTTLFSRLAIPIKPKKDDDKTHSSRTDLQWRPWFNSDLKNVQTLHNINLIVMSAIMLYGVVIESWRRIKMEMEDDEMSWPYFLVCEEPGDAKGALYYWSYMYYLSKYSLSFL